MNTLGSRIRSTRQDCKITQPELAKAIGVTKSAISQWETGVTKTMDGKKLIALAKKLMVNPEWLSTGEGEKYTQNNASAKLNGSSDPRMVSLEEWDDDTPLRDYEVIIPCFKEVELSVGSMRHQVLENNERKLRFSKFTLKERGVEIKDAACVIVSGNSMSPVLPDKSTIAIDTSKKDIINGKMYVIDHNGDLRVNLLYRLPGGGIRLKSYNNEEWPDETYQNNEIESIRVIGKVFWYSVLI